MVLLAAPAAAGRAAEPGGVCFGERATIVGTSDDDRIEGTDGRDVILALGGDDVIEGDDGNDRICGGVGADRIDGRYGRDKIDASGGADELRGGPGSDLLVGGGGRDWVRGGDGDAGGDTLVGGDGNDVLYGGDGGQDSDHLFGGEGNDFVDGGLGGLDLLYGGPGNDRLSEGTVSYEFAAGGVMADLGLDVPGPQAAGEGADTFSQVRGVIGSDHPDVVTGDAGPEVFRGRGGGDSIAGGGGPDRVDGGPGADELDGGDGTDIAAFEDSPAGVIASLRDGSADGGTLAGFEGLEGSYFDDELTGDDGPNTIYGFFGADEAFGLGGNDDIWGASGGDAGDGIDECINAFQVAACESYGHGDPPPLPFVSDPRQGADLDRLDVVRGGTAGGLGVSGDRVEVSIRRTTPNGCWWWDSTRGRFVRDVCGIPHGNVVPVRRGEWSLPVDVKLKPGVYLVGVKWADEFEYIECGGAFAPMCVELDVD